MTFVYNCEYKQDVAEDLQGSAQLSIFTFNLFYWYTVWYLWCAVSQTQCVNFTPRFRKIWKRKKKKQDTDMSDSFIVSLNQNLSHSLCFIELNNS